MRKVIILLFAMFSIKSFCEGSTLFVSDKSKDTLVLGKHTGLGPDELDHYYSSEKLGSFLEGNKTVFRLFAPTAQGVSLSTFKNADDLRGNEYVMRKDSNGVWEIKLNGNLNGVFYGYKVFHDPHNGHLPLCSDPYARAIASYTSYMNPRKSIVVTENNYDWQGDSWIRRDWRDYLIYEMHVRDMTAHKSSGAKYPGTYKGLVEKGIRGGIDYIKSLGVNAVELLPSQEYACVEIPYKDSCAGRFNTWNPYERNHWGYMTAGFFAPSAYYAEDWKEMKWKTWMGTSGRQVNEFKDMVKAFHKEGIAVIMDVVYNHISEYEEGNLKQIDKDYYFRRDDKGTLKTESGCGNDFKTERPMARRMIVESVLYWMKQYHIDGFRFDLAKLIDWRTVETIIAEAKKINPDVVIIAEPWGGGYDPAGFSQRGWAAWNDRFRNGIKGQNPDNGYGWIFGKWFENNNPQTVKNYVNGTLASDAEGLFVKKEHSVNYLASHDDYNLADFIRIASGAVKADSVITDSDDAVKLTPAQMSLNKLAALFLLTSQGMTMITEGQEFAEAKIIPPSWNIDDKQKGRLDHNSYNKDNTTNYLNYKHAHSNGKLLSYYKGLITLRNKYQAFRRAPKEDIEFIECKDRPFAFGYLLKYEGDEFMVLLNAENGNNAEFKLPKGRWQILVNDKKAGVKPISVIKDKVILKSKSGFVLKLKT
jgi:pullulanase/glycogen debranching enzyme